MPLVSMPFAGNVSVREALAANFFKSFSREEINFSEFRRVLVSLERIPSFDIPELSAFSTCDISEALKLDQSLLLSFVNAGLGQNNGATVNNIIVAYFSNSWKFVRN